MLNQGIGIKAAIQALLAFSSTAFSAPRASASRRRRCERHGAVLLHDGVHGHHRHDSHGCHGGTLVVEELLSSMVCGSPSPTAFTQIGYGEEVGSHKWGSIGNSGTERSTSLAPAWCMPWVELLPWRAPLSLARASASISMAKPQAIPGHSLPMAMIGCFILAFGWFGFNPGSTLSGTDLRISSRRRQHDVGQRDRCSGRDVLS